MMFNHDAGHSHGPTLGFVTDCPLCDAAKTARNQAIAHLSEALHLLSLINPTQARPTIRLNIAPIGLTGDDAPHCRSIDLTPKQAEGLADAVDSMNAYLGSESAEDDRLGTALRQAEDAIESGEWSAAAVAQRSPDLYADVIDLFAELDPIEITDKVIRDRQADLPDVAHLLDDLFGDIPYPYADEDVPLPHDQAQMDALTSEVESHLKDGEL